MRAQQRAHTPVAGVERIPCAHESSASADADDRAGQRYGARPTVDVLRTIAAARETVPPTERERVHGAACEITVLALLDSFEDPARSDATAEAVRAFVRGATAHCLAVLLERIGAREAHGIVHGLNQAGLIEPNVAQIAHARIDLRPTPASAG